MSQLIRKIPFKGWFIAHPSITGSLFGFLTGLVFGVLNVPGSVFLVAPFLAGVLAGYLGGSGAKAGILTLVLPVLVVLMIPLAFPSVDWTASTMPEVQGIGPINATFAALANGLIRSTWGIASGLAALSSALAGIITLIILIMIPILIVFGLAVTVVLGFVGGKIGAVIRPYDTPRINSTHQPPTQPLSQPTVPHQSTVCPTCNRGVHNRDADFCSNCGTSLILPSITVNGKD